MRREADFLILEKFPQEWVEKLKILAQVIDEQEYYQEPKAYEKAGIPYGKELKNLLKPLGLTTDDFRKAVDAQCESVRREKLINFLSGWKSWDEWGYGGGAVSEKLKKLGVRCDSPFVTPIALEFLAFAKEQGFESRDILRLKSGLNLNGIGAVLDSE